MKLNKIILLITVCFATQAGAQTVKPKVAKAVEEPPPAVTSFTVNDGSNRLKLGTRFILEPNISNVKDALNYVVRPTGYKLVANQPGLIDMNTLVATPLPPMAQVPANMTIERALLIIIGNKNRLVVDHKSRLIGVEPMSGQVATVTNKSENKGE
jgi:hypothetical protein